MVCAEGEEEATVAAAWASASRGAGAAVSVCPPGFLGSHAGASAGTYDSIVVEDGERGSGAVLGEVRSTAVILLDIESKVLIGFVGFLCIGFVELGIF